MQTRKQIRLKKYDYSKSGWYFITACLQNRQSLLGNIIDGKMKLNDFGYVVDKKINEMNKYKNVDIDVYCVMPNHIHMIIHIIPPVGADPRIRPSPDPCVRPSSDPRIRPSSDPRIRPFDIINHGSTQGSTNHGSTQGSTPTVGEYIKRLKTLTTKIYIDNVKNNEWKSFNKRLWQRGFYEHIIRNKNELNKIRKYIQLNPQMWKKDAN